MDAKIRPEEVLAEEAGSVETGREKEGLSVKETAVRQPRIPRVSRWVLAAAALLLGYVYLHGVMRFPGSWLARTDWTVGMAIFTALFVLSCYYYGRKCGKKRDGEALLFLFFTAAAALWLLLFGRDERQDICFFVILFLHGTGVYWALVFSGNRLDGRLDERCFLDLLRGLFALPFVHFGSWFLALGNLAACLVDRGQRDHKRTGQAAAGLALSLPVLLIVVPLLMGADAGFSRLLLGIRDGAAKWFGGIWDLSGALEWGFVLVIGCYLYGLIYGAFEEKRGEAPKRCFLPAAMAAAFLSVFVLLYGLFFLVKLAGIPQAMREIGSGELLRSAYARAGFFELCWIAAINFFVYSLAKWYWPEEKGSRKKAVWLSILGGETLGFIGLALFRMGVYIAGYGLTFKRVFTTWFMLLLFTAFVLLVAENWKKADAIRTAVLFGCVTFLMLAYSNIPAWTVG